MIVYFKHRVSNNFNLIPNNLVILLYMNIWKKTSLLFFVFNIAFNAFSQNKNPLFVHQQNGTNVIITNKEEATLLSDIAREYNVSIELLSLFNSIDAKDSFAANQEIIIPLTETNYIKDKLVATNSNLYKPLYHQGIVTQNVQEISKQYLLPTTKLMEWNKITTGEISANTNLLIGWVRTSNLTKANGGVVNSNINNGIKSVSNGLSDLGTGTKKVVNKVGDEISEAGKSIKNVTQKINLNNLIDKDSLAYSNENVDTVTLIEPPLVYQLSDEIFKTENLKKVNVAGAKIKTGFQKTTKSIGDLINKAKAANIKNPIDDSGTVAQKLNYNQNLKKHAQEEAAANEKQRLLLEKEKLKQEAEKNIEPSLEVKQNTEEKTPSIYDLAKNNNTENSNSENLSTEVVGNEEQKKVVAVKPKASEFKMGSAGWFYVGSTSGTYYIFTNYAPKGSIITVFDNKKSISIEAKVLGTLTAAEVQAGQIALLSDNAKPLFGNNEIIEIVLGR